MSTASQIEQRRARDARELDLLARLYREIGISAVAAALEVQVGATKSERISAQKLFDKGAIDSRAA